MARVYSKNSQNVIFDLAQHRISENPEEYIYSLLTKSQVQPFSANTRMSIVQLGQILKSIGLGFNKKQLHQLYLYATYDIKNAQKSSHKKALSLVNEESSNVNMTAVARWVQRKIKAGKNCISISVQPNQRTKKTITKSERSYTQANSEVALPTIKKNPYSKFTTEVGKVLTVFSEMERERQYAGLEPIGISSDQEEPEGTLPTRSKHYQGSFFEVNQKLVKLRDQAKKGILNVIEAAKKDKKLKQKFQEALMRYERVRTEANAKMGKCGAMKAQKRMIDKQQQDIKALQRWRQKTNQSELTTQF